MRRRGTAASAAAAERRKALDRWLGVPLQAAWRLLGAAAPRIARPDLEVRCIVLAKLWGVGNLAMILPYVDVLRRRYPRAHVVFLTLERNRPLVEQHPEIHQVITVREHGWITPVRDLLRAARTLRRLRVDLFLDFEQFLRVTGLLARAGRVRHAIGFDTPGQHRTALHHARVPYDPTRHMAEVFGDVVRAAGGVPEGPARLAVPRCPARTPVDLLPTGRPRPWIVLHAGSGDNFPGRRWPVERFAAVGERLLDARGGTLLLTGNESEMPLAAELAGRLRRRGIRAVDLSGRLQLPELIETLARADLVISNDTGPVHLAAAVGTAVVALYGPNTPRLYGPLGERCISLYHELPCSPCLTNLNAKSSSCRYPVCILSLDVQEVAAAGLDLLRTATPLPVSGGQGA